MPRPPRARRSCHIVPGSSPQDAGEGGGDRRRRGGPRPRGLGRRGRQGRGGARGRCGDRGRRARRGDPGRARERRRHAPLPSRHRRGGREGRAPRSTCWCCRRSTTPGHVTFADHLLSALEEELGLPPRGIGLEAQIETARGLAAVEAIAACCTERLEALVVGPGDLAASLGMPHTADRRAGAGLPRRRLEPRARPGARGRARRGPPGRRRPLRGDRRRGGPRGLRPPLPRARLRRQVEHPSAPGAAR